MGLPNRASYCRNLSEPDALNRWAREQNHDSGVVTEMLNGVEASSDCNPLDLYYAIRSIGIIEHCRVSHQGRKNRSF